MWFLSKRIAVWIETLHPSILIENKFKVGIRRFSFCFPRKQTEVLVSFEQISTSRTSANWKPNVCVFRNERQTSKRLCFWNICRHFFFHSLLSKKHRKTFSSTRPNPKNPFAIGGFPSIPVYFGVLWTIFLLFFGNFLFCDPTCQTRCKDLPLLSYEQVFCLTAFEWRVNKRNAEGKTVLTLAADTCTYCLKLFQQHSESFSKS